MKLVAKTAPYIRKPVSVKRMMIDVIIALLPLVLFACIQNGWNGIYVFLISIGTMVINEIIANLIIKWPKGLKFKELFSKEGFLKVKDVYTINNFTAPIISALIYALIMPSGCYWYVVFIGALFGILFGKMIFGGLGNNIFNPAAIGRVFVGICFGSSLVYNKGGVDVSASGTPLALIKGNLGMIGNALNEYSIMDLFIGNVPGSMGEVCSILIIISAIYLFVRRSADLRACLSMLLSFAVVTFSVSVIVYLKVDNPTFNVLELFLYEMLSGGLLFGAVFMITDPVTSPTTKYGRVVFGFIAGILTALIRYCGAYPEGVAFSIIIANIFSSAIDYLMRGRKNGYTLFQILGLAISLIIICLIVGFKVAYQLGGL